MIRQRHTLIILGMGSLFITFIWIKRKREEILYIRKLNRWKYFIEFRFFFLPNVNLKKDQAGLRNMIPSSKINQSDFESGSSTPSLKE